MAISMKKKRINSLINIHTSLRSKNVTEVTRKAILEEIENLLKADQIVPMS